MTAAYPPIVPSWNGNPASIVEESRKYLAMKLSDPNMATLQRLCGSAMELVRTFLGWASIPDTGQAVVPDPVRDATIGVLVEAYRRKDLSFGVITSADADNVAFRVSADWMISNYPQLTWFKASWGVA